MRTCTIYGDMQSDSAAEQYPTVTLCDSCVAEDKKAGPDSQILNEENYDPAYGDTCDWCSTTAAEEAAHNADSPTQAAQQVNIGEITELRQVNGQTQAQRLLNEGWRILAVCVMQDGSSQYAEYHLGRSSPKSSSPKSSGEGGQFSNMSNYDPFAQKNGYDPFAGKS